MEVVQGKSKDRKIIIAQEIAFAKVLAGNNKTLRDRAVKKLKKWLTVRGNGKWTFTEDEFIRIWTGLFYCMWMSDKFLVQEELAESISKFIHCFRRNTESALLFIKTFHKVILKDWEGLDQYRIDKFNMFARRFLRQTFLYCREKDWEESLLYKLMGIFYNVVLHRDNSLGYVLHFIDIYAEELAKVSKGKLGTEKVLQLIEPFAKLLARTKDSRIQAEVEGFFKYLMRQTDAGIEFEEKFKAWRQQGFPGTGPQCMKTIYEENDKTSKHDSDISSEDEQDEEETENEILDPRAGSVHVFLPQIPLDLTGVINMLQKHINSPQTTVKGRRILRTLVQKFGALRKGRFPSKIRKDPILTERPKSKQTQKIAAKLLKFTENIDRGPLKTKEFEDISKELDEDGSTDEESDDLNSEEDSEIENEDIDFDEEVEKTEPKIEKKKKLTLKKKKSEKMNNKKEVKKVLIKEKIANGTPKIKNKAVENGSQEAKILNATPKIKNKAAENGNEEEKILNGTPRSKKRALENGNEDAKIPNGTPKRKKKGIGNENMGEKISNGTPESKNKDLENGSEEENIPKVRKKKRKESPSESQKNENFQRVTPINKRDAKCTILGNWQVEDLDLNDPAFYKLKTPKIIRIEKKINEDCSCEEREIEEQEVENGRGSEKKTKEVFLPTFWDKARAKTSKKIESKTKLLVNPFADVSNDSKSPGRRISFALDKNMAQENEEYLEEVKNSPRVPFDGSKMPIQSALKSGLTPSPVNPFYRFKKMKF